MVGKAVLIRKNNAFKDGKSKAWEQMEHRGFLSSETILYDATVVDTCHYAFANTKSEP